MVSPSKRLAGILLGVATLALWTGASSAADEAAVAPKLSRLQGKAYIDRHNVVVGAAVLVHPQGNDEELFLTSTDEDGRFRLDGLPDGAYRVIVKRAGMETVVKDEVTLKFPFRAVVEFPMKPEDEEPDRSLDDGVDGTAPILARGRVVESGGEPIGDVRLRLTHPTGQRDPHVFSSDEYGDFEVPDLPPGEWRLEARGVGFLPLRASLDLDRDTRIELFLVRQPANYEPTPFELMPTEQPIPPLGLDP